MEKIDMLELYFDDKSVFTQIYKPDMSQLKITDSIYWRLIEDDADTTMCLCETGIGILKKINTECTLEEIIQYINDNSYIVVENDFINQKIYVLESGCELKDGELIKKYKSSAANYLEPVCVVLND